MTSLEALLKEGTKVLEKKKIQEARLDAWLLLEYVTGMNRAFYFCPFRADGGGKSRQIPGTDRDKEQVIFLCSTYPSGIFYGL